MDAGGNNDKNNRPLSQPDTIEATASLQKCAVTWQSESQADYFLVDWRKI